MTAQEWLSSSNPADMLRHIRRGRSGRVHYEQPVWFARYKKNLAPRKMRLFLLACCRRICQGCLDASCEELLQVAERHVETPPPLLHEDDLLRPFYAGSGPTGAICSALRNPLGLAAAHLRLYLAGFARAAAGGESGIAAESARWIPSHASGPIGWGTAPLKVKSSAR